MMNLFDRLRDEFRMHYSGDRLALALEILSIVQRRMQVEAERAPMTTPAWMSQALNEGDGTYRP